MLVGDRKPFTKKKIAMLIRAMLYNRHKQELYTITASLFKISTFHGYLHANELLYMWKNLRLT